MFCFSFALTKVWAFLLSKEVKGNETKTDKLFLNIILYSKIVSLCLHSKSFKMNQQKLDNYWACMDAAKTLTDNGIKLPEEIGEQLDDMIESITD